MAKAKPGLRDAPEGGVTFDRANPNYIPGVVVEGFVGEDTTASLRRKRLAGEEPMSIRYIAGPDGVYRTEEGL